MGRAGRQGSTTRCARRSSASRPHADGGHRRRGPEVACKPSSVPAQPSVYVPRRDFLPSGRPAAAIHLALPLPAGSSGQPGDRAGLPWSPIRPCSGWGLPGLRCHHRSGELLPHLFTLIPTCRDGMFLWHFPSGHPAPPLAGILPGGARTFLLPDASGRRPPGYLGPSYILTRGRRSTCRRSQNGQPGTERVRGSRRPSRRSRRSGRYAPAESCGARPSATIPSLRGHRPGARSRCCHAPCGGHRPPRPDSRPAY